MDQLSSIFARHQVAHQLISFDSHCLRWTSQNTSCFCHRALHNTKFGESPCSKVDPVQSLNHTVLTCHLFYQSLLIMLFFFQPSSSFFYSDSFLVSFSSVNCKFENYTFYIFLQVTNEYLKSKYCPFGHHLCRKIKNVSNPSVYTLSANRCFIS